MFGLDYLVATHFMLAKADVECKLRKTPQIEVVASDTNVKYDHSKTQNQLDNFDIDTVSPYAANVQTHVGGLMSGEVSVAQNIRIMQETFPTLNTGCLYLDSIKVNIHINPTIYIAKDYLKTGCMYKAVMEHEKKHIRVDREIINKYTNIIINGLNNAFKKAGFKYGPYSTQELPIAQGNIQKYAQEIVKQYSDAMTAERQARQQEVDSLAEYTRVNNLCRGKP